MDKLPLFGTRGRYNFIPLDLTVRVVSKTSVFIAQTQLHWFTFQIHKQSGHDQPLDCAMPILIGLYINFGHTFISAIGNNNSRMTP